MLDRDIQHLDQDLKAFRSRVKKMVTESKKEAKKHVAKEELPLEVPFHEGEAGGYEIVLSVLNDLSEKRSRVSLNALEETYLGLLIDYKRIRGSAGALETALTEMQRLFDLPSEKEVEQSERLAKRVSQYAAKS
ncbi:MAG TPA: hypothetical protein VKF36_13905 [Syntrophorhabdales bacterium]|nr:hypothetical protein [Syntrophorhabdales bacterium]